MIMTDNNYEAKGRLQDQIRGCLIGGAVGDALGYAIEFDCENAIFSRYGKDGIQEYELDKETGKAIISDDTQMTLFTANGILVEETKEKTSSDHISLRACVVQAYQDWLTTQDMRYQQYVKQKDNQQAGEQEICGLMDVPELFRLRAPGNTCLSALTSQRNGFHIVSDYIKEPVNNSKGCGGIMRVAPAAFIADKMSIEDLDYEGAQLAAITHGHSLGYMPAAVVTHIIRRIVFPENPGMGLKEIVLEARDAMKKLFAGDENLEKLTYIIDLAVELSENDGKDLDNIHRLGEGWVAEETMGISLYCALKYEADFSAGVLASVNHKGDSDSTGAVTGNILGALHGYDAMEEKWKTNLELRDVILEMADDLCRVCLPDDSDVFDDSDWRRRYLTFSSKGENND